MTTLTAANIRFALVIPDIYPVPQILEGYGVDDAFSTETLELAQVRMGVDGKMKGGYVPNPIVMPIKLMPTSNSIAVFENWGRSMVSAREVFEAQATITYPSLGKAFICNVGILTHYKPLPDVKKLLEDVDYEITWQDIKPINI